MSILSIHLQRVNDVVERRALRIMIVLALLGAIAITMINLLDHIGLRTELNDLGRFSQATWQVTQGKFHMPVSNYTIGESWLRSHASFILYIIAPLYALFPSPYTLLLLPGIAIASASIALFLLAQHILGNNKTALLFGLMVLIHPSIEETALYDFHPEILAIAFVIFAIVFLEKKRYTLYWVFIALLLLVKEDMPLLVLFLSPLVWRRTSWKMGSATAFLAILYGAGLIAIGTFLFDGAIAERLMFRFAYILDLPDSVMKYLSGETQSLSAPLPSSILSYGKVLSLAVTFVQGGFLAMAAPSAALAAVPNLLQNMLDSTGFQSRISGVYYAGIPSTMLLIAAVYGYKHLRNAHPSSAGILFDSTMAFMVYLHIIFSPLPTSITKKLEDLLPVHDPRTFAHMVSLIPREAAVATQNNMGVHLANRNIIMRASDDLKEIDYVALGLFTPYRRKNDFHLQADDYRLWKPVEHATVTEHIFADERFGVVWYESPFYLFQKGYSRALNAEALLAAQRDIEQLGFDENGRNRRFDEQ